MPIRQYDADISNVGVNATGQPSKPNAIRHRRRSTARKPPSLPPMRNMTGTFSERWRK